MIKIPNSFSLTGRQKVLTQIAPMFTQAILKKWERKTPPTFPQTGHEKGVETGKGAVDPRKIVTTHASFVTFITFFPVALKNCQFLAALPSVDAAENGSRFIMIQDDRASRLGFICFQCIIIFYK